ncbi:unnamed protein product [Lasius platythorax]|uniref:Uncharacterized protein n=1 Tax=Lasius platythorax TaxID=488582 RepID=A0AAV2NXM5_9HYME
MNHKSRYCPPRSSRFSQSCDWLNYLYLFHLITTPVCSGIRMVNALEGSGKTSTLALSMKNFPWAVRALGHIAGCYTRTTTIVRP